MPKYVVHVGPSKTGTTYLQGSLHHTRASLREHGILYPPNWWQNRRAVNHEFLVDKIRAGDDPVMTRAFAELNESDYRIVVFSFEGFPTLSNADLERFKALLGGNEVSIVFYLRRWSDRLPSSWQQLVRGGSSIGFPDFLTRLMVNPHRTPALNYTVVLDRFAAVFGKESLRIVSYNNVLERKQDLFRHFCRFALDADYVGELPPSTKNESFNIYDTEIFRVVNVLEGLETDKTKANLLRRYVATRGAPELAALRTEMKEYLSEVRVSDRTKVFQDLYEQLGDRYHENMVDPVEKLGLFRRKARVVQYVKPDYLLRNGAGDTIRAMHQRIRAAA